MRIFAIGDIHGHLDELLALYDKLQKEAGLSLDNGDHLVFLGDLVDVGDNTKEVIEFVMLHKRLYPENLHVVKGNHDLMLVDALTNDAQLLGGYDIWFGQGGRQSISSYFPEHLTDYERAISQPREYIPQEHLDFLAELPWYWETPEFFFVHGGVPPDVSLEWTKEHFDKHPEALFENFSPLWIREKFYWSEYDWGKKIIFAHTPFSDGKGGFKVWKKDNMIGVNTMPRNVGHLTCVQLDTENPDDAVFYKSPERGEV